MRKKQLTLLGSLLCVLTLTACNVEVNVDGDINANIDTSIDLGDDTGSDTGDVTDEDSDTKEDIPTEITLSLTASAEEVTVGDSVDISFSTSPAGVSVSFSSSDTSLATVTNNGHVTTLAPGTVTITAVASLEGYNDVSESIVITINPVIDEGGDTGSGGGTGGDDEGTGGGSGSGDETGDEPGSTDVTTYGVEITNGESLTPLEIGETVAVSVSLLTITNDEETGRDIATADDVKLSSSETGVLSINDLEITALSAGETILTATWTEKEVHSSGVSIIVNSASGGGTTPTPEPEPDPEPETVTVTFDPTSYTVEEESTVQTSLTTEPSGANVTYTSSDTSVATVNASGLVTGVKAGETIVTATATYEGYNAGTATCTITVTEKASDEPGYYVLYGDFVGADWEGFPNSGDDTYLGYTSNNSKYWVVTITTLPQPESATWNAGFRIVYAYWDPNGGDEGNGENVYETIADYSALDTVNSTGTLGASYDSDGNANISLHWDTTYTITIDLRDSENPYILVIMDTTGMEYDSCYALYGDFVESNWDPSPSEDSDFYLAYNSSDNSTKYWSVRATISDMPADCTWDAGFRVIAYGDYSTTIADYSNLASGSTGVVGTNNDGNICVNWSGTYDIVIDMTGSTPSILVTLVTDTGDDPSIDEPVTAEYALVGDFNDSSWNASPDKSSKYYHYYSSADESTYTWELTVTMAAGTDKDYDPSFYVTPYGEWSAVIGFSELDGNSTGVKSEATNDGGIRVDWGCTYDIFIDLRDSSNFSILVTLVEDEEEDETYNIDGYYVLSGNLDGATWSLNPGYDSDYALPYDSTKSNSKYWTRTITTGSNPNDGTSDPSFRILDYSTNESWNTIANFNNLTIDSASTGVLSNYVGGDYNIGLDNWNTTYDLTIDMRGSTWTILINYHDDSFEAGINGKAGGSSSSGVEGDALGLDDTYAMGMDTSSIVEVLNAGGTFYDDSGNKLNGIDDFMSYLSTKGVNYIRIRLWNDPKDSSGNSYKGGGNDLTTDLTIAEAAVKAGMKICLDLHYSDFWAHHGQQYVPKAWSSLGDSDLISTAAAWTTATLQSFKDVNCTPSMVQVGNETNGNQICGLTGNSNSAISFFTQCCSAVRTFDSSIQIVIHYSDDQNIGTYESNYNALINGGCDFDVIGLSYYSYYHESMSEFRNTLSTLSSYYSSKKICIMEYSYGYTVDWQYVASSDTLDDQDGGVMQNEFWTDDAEAGGYDASVAGQTSYVYDVNQAVASLSNGIGSFYWEPAWLALDGTCWASSYSDSYYQANNQSNSGYDVCTWANQALFDYSGHPLATLSIYNQMWGK